MQTPFGHPLADLRYANTNPQSVVATLNSKLIIAETTTGKKYYQLLFQIRGDSNGDDCELVDSHAVQTLWPQSPWHQQEIARLAGIAENKLPDQDDLAEWVVEQLKDVSLAMKVQLNRDGYLQVKWIQGRGEKIPTNNQIGLAAPLPDKEVPSLPLSLTPDFQQLKSNYLWVDTQGKVGEVVDKASEFDCIGLDLETDFAGDPPEKWNASDGSIRLMQLSAKGSDGSIWTVCIDCWAVNIRPIIKALLRDSLTKVVHYLPFEQEWLHYHYGMAKMENAIDTCLAWKIIERQYLKLDSAYQPIGSQLAQVVERLWGLELNKDQQQADWSLNPLPQNQREYAALDAALLWPLYCQLKELATDLGVWEQICAASTLITEDAIKRGPKPNRAAEAEAVAKINAATSIVELNQIAADIRRAHLPNISRQELGNAWVERKRSLN